MRIFLLNFLIIFMCVVIKVQQTNVNKTSVVLHKSKTRYRKSDFMLDRKAIKCYNGLGCVELNDAWFHLIYRPTNLFPLDRHIVNTQFVHWYMDSDHKPTNEIIPKRTHAGLKVVGLSSVKKLTIIIHDFTSNGYTGWIKHLANAILRCHKRFSHVGVVSVDWQRGAEAPYIQACANARLAALEVVLFLEDIKKAIGLEATHVHLIGHGLGAHLAGYVGKLYPNIHHITGLDPSGPQFTGMPPQVKLCRDDASYVEVVHTDSGWGGQGTKDLMGDVDFFVNGGKHQPGCGYEPYYSLTSISRCTLAEGCILKGCSHKRAYKYYIESVCHGSCSFYGYQCCSYELFKEGKCTDCGDGGKKCAHLGAEAPVEPKDGSHPHPHRKYYMMTNDCPLFCIESLLVTVQFTKENKSNDYFFGHLKFKIVQKDEDDVVFRLRESSLFPNLWKSYHRYTYLVRHSVPPVTLFPVHHVQLIYFGDTILKFLNGRGLVINHIEISKLIDSNENRPKTKLCASTDTGKFHINYGEIMDLYPCTHHQITKMAESEKIIKD